MSLALLTLGLLCAPSAQAQGVYPGGGGSGSGGGSGGYPGGGWSVLDPANNPIVPDSSGYSLKGYPSGAADNHYPKDMTDAATAPAHYDNYGQWVDNSQWLQSASGGPHTYDPNPLGVPYLYPPAGEGPLSTSIALNFNARNCATNNNYFGSFNKGSPPFFTDQMYQNPSDCEPVNGSVTGDVKGTLWAYWTWTGSSPAPVDHLNILLTTNVVASKSLNYGNSGQTGGLTATAQASDGNPFNESASVGGVPQVIGHHLLRVPVSNGVAAVSLNGNVQGSASNSIPYGAFGYPYYTNYYGSTNGPTTASSIASVSGTAAIDTNNREVTISCLTVDTSANGGSKYRDPALTGPVITNVRQSDGTLRGDTVRPYVQPIGGTQDETQDYHANVGGTWGSYSSYLWNSQYGGPNPGDFTESGTFTAGVNDVPDHYPDYTARSWDLNGDPTIVDHIYIHLIDSAGGADLTSNYYMHFHEQYEPTSWPEDGSYPRKQTTQIDPDVPSWPTYSWYAEVNPDTGGIDSVVGAAGAATTFPYTGTETQSWHLDGGLGIAKEPVDLHFGGGYDKDVTNRTSGSSPALPVPLLRGQKTWVVWRKDIKRHRGHLDTYGTHGYTSTGVWYRDEDVGVERNIYYPYANAATENAHDPDPNWNPYN